MIGIELGNFLMIIVNFLLLMYVLKIFLYKPMLDFLDQRSEKIKNLLETAEKKRDDAEKMENQYKELLNEAKNEAAQMKENAQKESILEGKKIIHDAETKAKQIVDNANNEIEQNLVSIQKDIQKEIVELAVLLASKIAKEELDKQKHEQIIREMLATWKRK